MDEKTLKEFGYVKYPSGRGDYCIALWQKAVRNEEGKSLYFLNIYCWEFPNWNYEISWSVESRFYLKDSSFDLNFHPEKETIEEIEAFYKDAYNKLDCVPDKHND